MDGALNRIAQFVSRHDKALSILSGLWLALSCAAYARFIDLPDIPFVTDQNAWVFSGAWNAAWWGFLHPAIAKRRKAIEAPEGEEAKGD